MRNRQRGHLVLIGGAEDKNDKMEVLRKVVNINNAKTVAVIPTASSYTYELGRKYLECFRSLGVNEAKNLDIRYRNEVDKPEYLEFISQSDLIFFTGGDQVKLVETLKNTELLIRIWQRYFNGATIAGTSAGAAAASDPMIYDGDYCGFSKGCVQHGEGFGFIKEITIDTHFVERSRIPRLSQFLASGKSTKGIGLSEDTGVIIYPKGFFEVIGSGVVTVLNSHKTISDYHHVQENSQITVDGMRLSFLSKGSRFDLKKWTLITEEKVHSPVGKGISKLKLTIDKYVNMNVLP